MALAILKLNKLDKIQRINRADLQNDLTPIFRGAKCKFGPHHADQWVKHPKNIYGMPLFEVGVEIQFKFEFKFKLELNRKEKQKKRKKKTVAQPTWAGLGQKAQLLLHGPQGQSPLGQAD